MDTRFPAATAGVAASLIRVPLIADLVSVLKDLSIVLRVGVTEMSGRPKSRTFLSSP